MNRVHESLHHVFLNHRLVVWYDAQEEWRETALAFAAENLEVLEVCGNPFGTKVKVLTEEDASKRFLIYVPGARPPDAENWLLDLVLQGHEFKADRVSLAVQEAGLRYEYRSLVERFLPFFKSRERVAALQERLRGQETEDELVLHMMGVFAGTPTDVDSMLRKFLVRALEEPMFDPVPECLKAGDLPELFWKEVGKLFGYGTAQPTVRDFVVFLFRGANPLDPNVKLNAHAAVFLQQWKDSKAYQAQFEDWSRMMAKELNIGELLKSTGTVARIGSHDAFEEFDRFVLHACCRNFVEGGMPLTELQGVLDTRRQSYWVQTPSEERKGHAHGYKALGAACALRELLEGLELAAPSLAEAMRRYQTSWWRLDRAYRHFCHHTALYAQSTLFVPVTDWVERNYLNGFLLPISDLWSDLMSGEADWSEIKGFSHQRGFFEERVRPIVRREQKAVVVISDALRYEAGLELAERLRNINRITVEMEGMLASLPGYTQLGMASLLPGVELSVNPESGLVAKDGKPTAGVENRSAVLAAYLPGGGCAMNAESFLALNSQTEGRPLMKANDVIYVYHNTIDKTGDDLQTEAQTPGAVEESFAELERIIRKAVSINFTHVLVTADHGFLFQQNPVGAEDATPVPEAGRLLMKNRRFVFGEKFQTASGVILRQAVDLGLPGDWSCAFPRSLGRFPLKGSGKRFVHGGITPQEMLVPVLRIRKKRSDDVEKVAVEVMRLPGKITTGQLAVAFYQYEPVSAKVQAVRLAVQLKAEDGKVLSDRVVLDFNSTSQEPRKREQSAVLTLSKAADPYNNRDVILDICELRGDGEEGVPFREERLRLQKSYEGDFDEF